MNMFRYNPNADSNGCSFQGYIKTSYDKLVDVFGEPKDIRDEKVNYEWSFENTFTDEPLAFTIYDWKTPVYRITSGFDYKFHIGGLDKKYTEEFIKWLVKKLK